MPTIPLPAQVPLKCPTCKQSYALPREALHERRLLFCPSCGQASAVYDCLSLPERRRVYAAVRSHLEQRLYEQQRLDDPDYSEDSAALFG